MENNLPDENFSTGPLQIPCKNCGAYNVQKNNYCNACGKPLKSALIPVDEEEVRGVINQVIAFFVSMVIIIGLLSSGWFDITLGISIFFDFVFAGVVVAFAIYNWDHIKRLYHGILFKPLRIIILTLSMVAFAWIVSKVSGYMNQSLFNADVDSLGEYWLSPYPLLTAIVFVGVFPAVFEELAFRGFLFNHLLRFTNPRTVIITTGILFACIHFSFLSLGWYIPLGIFFGYLRFRYRTLWYSMLCHFVYNTTLVCLDYF